MRFASLVRSTSILSLLSLAALSPTGCTNSGGGSPGSGGSASGGSGPGSGGDASGGTTGSGGSSGSGGSAPGSGGSGSGGSVASGGATGSGGSVGSGGATGSGGSGAKGGATGSGGSATGGSTGSGGAGSGGASASGGATGTGGTATGGSSAGGSGAGGAAPGGSGGASTGCSLDPLTTTGVLNGRYGSMLFDNNYYFMQVNEWNSSASQVMSYGGDYLFKMTTQMASTATNGGPTGFPSIFIGANSRHMTTGSNLPKAVTALTTVPVSWTWDDAGTLADATNNSYNATYDVWFSTSSAGEPTASGPSGGFLMVWYHKPADAQPIGSAMKKAQTIAGISGTWDVWIGMNGTKPCISYVSTTDLKSFSFDLNSFIQDAVKNQPNTIQSGWYLTNIFTGFEIWRGGVNLQTTSFCAKVN
jgi:hypothetical protein